LVSSATGVPHCPHLHHEVCNCSMVDEGVATEPSDLAMLTGVRALDAARALLAKMPAALAQRYGDVEGFEWWESHAGLFEEARKAWGPRCRDVYRLAPSLDSPSSSVASAVLAQATWLQDPVRQALANGSPSALRSILQEVCRDSAGHAVYTFDLFTPEFCDALLHEMDHLEESGIPLRRPNGMNRYGAILSHLGFQEGLLEPLMRCVLAPLGHELWPEWVCLRDCDETYGFIVRYRIGEDVDLAEHADTSNITLNVCLGRDFADGDLYFKGVRFTDSEHEQQEYIVGHRKGIAVLHLGGHFHGVRPISKGERSNLVVWGTGADGVVRIRPDSPKQRSRRILCGFS